MGEIQRRKNLAGLLKAFHLEFTPNEPVSLLIKGHVPGSSPMESNRTIRAMIEEIKNGLRLYPSKSDYHNEIIITQWLDDTEVMRLHQTGDCFVLPSYGEAWGIPGFEAMALGKPVILTDEGGPAEYVEDGVSGRLVPSRAEPVMIHPNEQIPDVWIGNENWQAPDLAALRHYMREIYENKELRDKFGNNGIDRAYEFSYQKVGQTMKGLLDGTVKPVLYDGSTALREKHSLSAMAAG